MYNLRVGPPPHKKKFWVRTLCGRRAACDRLFLLRSENAGYHYFCCISLFPLCFFPRALFPSSLHAHVLRSRKCVPWIVGMTVQQAFPLPAYCCIPLQPHLAYVNHPTAIKC